MKTVSRVHPLSLALATVGLCSIPTPSYAASGMTALTTSATTIANTSGNITNVEQDKSNQPVNVGTVSKKTASRKSPAMLRQLPTQEMIFKSGETKKVLGKNEIQAAGPAGGAAQALAFAPGVNISSYGGSAGAKYSISINGIKTGWAGFGGGNVDDGSIMVTFDGVPLNNPGTGLWQAPEVPQMSLIKGIGISYGPGSVANRWYDNIGGAINFDPIQPGQKPGGSIGITYGSFDTKGIHFNATTGNINGWSAVIGGGQSTFNSYRNGYGFSNPGKTYAYYLKIRKSFKNGDWSLGAYDAQGYAYRPLPIPLSPISSVTVNGVNAQGNPNAGTLYSEQTSGYYTSLPYNLINKLDLNATWLIYSRLHLELSHHVELEDLLYYRHGRRYHTHNDNYFTNNPYQIEYNNPYSNMYGDKLTFSVKLPYNTVKFGGFFLNNTYNSRNAFYNASLGTSLMIPTSYRSDYFYQTDLAVFLQDTIQPIKSLSITPGFRFINYQTNFVNNGAADFPYANPANNEAVLPNASTSFRKFEPNVSINYRPLHWLAFYGNYGESYRQPPNGGGGGPYQAVTASTLQLEKSSEYQAGIKVNIKHADYLHHVLFSANYYHMTYSNETIPIPVVNEPYELNAVGSSVYNGVNLYAEDDPVKGLHIFTNVNFQSSHFLNYTVGSISYNGLPVSNSASTTFNVGGFLRYYYNGTLLEPRLWYQYTGSQYLFSNLLGAPTSQKMPSYGTLNAALRVTGYTKNIIPFVKKVSAELMISNLLNSKYNVAEYITAGGYFGPNSAGQVLGFPGAPRAFYASFTAYF